MSATDSVPAVTSWADDAESDLPNHQMDAAGVEQMGSEAVSSLLEPEFDVDVKLNDLQQDPNNPLFSVKNFSDLNLYVFLNLT